MTALAAAAAILVPSAATAALPDGRAYELVSPPNKLGNEVGQGAFGPSGNATASTDGNGVMYAASGVIAESDRGVQTAARSQRTPSGWVTRNPINGPDPSIPITFLSVAPSLTAISDDLSRMAFVAGGSYGPPNPYSDLNGDSAAIYLTRPDGLPTWLTQPTSPDAYPKPGSLLSESVEMAPVGGSPDLSTVYFFYCGTLTAEDAPRNGRLAQELAQGFYEFRDGRLRTAGVLPDGSVDPDGAAPASDSGSCAGQGGASFRDGSYVDAHPVSDDGSRAFFVSPSPASSSRAGQVYVRRDGTETVLVSRSAQTGAPAPSGVVGLRGSDEGQFAFASPDGGTVIFASTDSLTSDAPDDGAAKRYAFDVDTRAVRFLPETTGLILAVANGGGTIVSTEIVDPDSSGTQQQTIKVEHAGATYEVGTYLGYGGSTGLHLSTDGRTLVFQVDDSLSGLTDGTQQVYRWTVGDAAPDCLSCARDGATPSGDAFVSRTSTEFGGLSFTVKDTRNVTPDGRRVVFESPDPLLPQDTNGRRDVYQWSAGRLALISSGTGSSHAYLMDSSVSGDDVFFATRQRLVADDTDDSSDVYDARVGGGFPRLPAPPTCAGDDCRVLTPDPPPGPAPTSTGISGSGNLSPAKVASPVRVVRGRSRRGMVVVRVTVSAPGRISVTGSGLRATRRNASRGATYTVAAPVSAATRRVLERRGRRTLHVRVGFAPADKSRSSSTTVTLTVRK